MDKNLETRQSYLNFAFTTSITILAAFLVFSSKGTAVWLILFPFCVIIPFQARISYYRIIMAKYEAYMKVFHCKEIQLYHFKVDELRGLTGIFISLIANYELTILSLSIDACYFAITKPTDIISTKVLFPVCLTFIVAFLATYTYSYLRFEKRFENEYKNYIKNKKEKN